MFFYHQFITKKIKIMRKKFTLSGLSLFILLFISGFISAQNPAYVEETFSYDDDELDATTISTLSDGVGWLSEWTMQDGDAITFNIEKGVASVLGNAKRIFSNPLVDNGTEDIWIYTKLKSGTATTAGYAGISLWNGENEDFFIGQEWNKTVDAVRGGGWGGPNYTTAIDATIDVVFLIKIETMGPGDNETAYVWINPVLNGTVPETKDTTGSFSFAMPTTYDFLSLRSDQTIYCDFIKLGTNVEKILEGSASASQIESNNMSLKNYPNPVKATTNISYSLPENGAIKIELFDTSGKIVKSINNLNSQAGYHSVQIDATELNPGMYYYRLTQKNNSTTKKMVVIR
jgi:hypothetical protein